MKSIAFVLNGYVVNLAEFDDSYQIPEGNDAGYGEGSIAVDITGIESQVQVGYQYVDGKFGPPPPPVLTKEQEIQKAEYERSQLLDTVKWILNEWDLRYIQVKALIGRASEEEISQLGKWIDYFQAVEAVDTSNAPDIVWPEQPTVTEKSE